MNKEATAIVREAVNKHGRVIFNGNGFAADWIKEAKKRGLPNISNTVDALAAMANDSAVKLFEKYKVLSGGELHARYEVYLEQYTKHINIEAKASIDMVRKQYIPSVIDYLGDLGQASHNAKSIGLIGNGAEGPGRQDQQIPRGCVQEAPDPRSRAGKSEWH